MELNIMTEEFHKAFTSNRGMHSLSLTMDEIAEICNYEYEEKYGNDYMGVLKLIEETDELIMAVSSSPSGAANDPFWRLSEEWFGLVEETVDTYIMAYITGYLFRKKYGYKFEVRKNGIFDVVNESFKLTLLTKMLSIINHGVIKGFRKLFDKELGFTGRLIIMNQVNEIGSLYVAIQRRFQIDAKDLDTMMFVKCKRLLDKYNYEYDILDTK